ncbi:hypothetical protein [Bacillus sp. CHD6a]|uniref:hypothetical protein n=1 Tax=Bacillus sp. CHD6a TaxID=1643452 RepID=UPI0006CE1356|nr:hypothetical protein [Bacillus sp. CHD6a]KPB04498.1 hypothetical protein AAV98_11250 [Bacillus sp. CHD6a]
MRKERLLRRLDEIGLSLERTQGALLLLGLGSVGNELDRLDEFSDLDFFVIVKPGYKRSMGTYPVLPFLSPFFSS